MKKFLLLAYFLCFFATCLFGQSSRIEISNFKYRVRGDEKICETYVKLTAYFKDQAPVVFFHEYYGEGTFTSPSPKSQYEFQGEITKIHVYAYTHEKRGGRTCGSGKGTKIAQDNYIDLLSTSCKIGSYYDYVRNGGEFEAENELWFDYEIYPIIEVNQITDDNIGYTKELNLSVTSGSNMYDPSVYNWEYHIEGDKDSVYVNPPFRPGYWRVFDVWRAMPVDVQGEKTFNIVPKDFLEADGFLPKDVINKNISFRIDRCSGNTTNVVTRVIRKAAPAIVSTQGFRSTCYDSGNASLRVYFDRQVDPGELISYVLYDKSIVAFTENGKDYYYPTRNSNNITQFDETGSQYYLDILNIPSSEDYYFEIIGYDGNPYDDTGFDDENGEVEDSGYEGAVLYTGDGTYATDIRIEPTPPVEFTIENKEDISCNGAADGKIHLLATGGLTDQYQYIMYDDTGNIVHQWTNFSTGTTHTITIENGGTYKIYVKDINGCEAITYDIDPSTGEIQNTATQIEEVTINEPEILVVTKNGEPSDPKAFGFTDGGIYIKVIGGTPIGGNSYNVSWKDGKGNSYTGSNSRMENKYFYQDLLNIGDGTYTATITDAKGCETNIVVSISEPDKLELTLEETNPISCNSANSDDEFKLEDGQLTATASGGMAPYIYTWKKKKADGTWEILKTTPKISTASTLDYLGQGEYAVNIKDANDIVIGQYQNNTLIKETDVIYDLKEPNPITITFTKEDVYCKGGNNGWIRAMVTGGTLNNGEDYILQWSNGESTTRIENLYAGSYTLYVTDSNGCYQEETITIEEPADPLQLNYTNYKQPSAAGLTDGYIEATITGGSPTGSGTYSYTWTDEQGNNLNSKVSSAVDATGYVITLNNIGKGDYYLTITDANYNKTTVNSGCTIENDKFPMDEPDPMELTIEETGVISCNALNEHGNPSADGELTAHAKGGVWLRPGQNNGLPYFYTWKKKNASGNWSVLTEQTDSIASNLDVGQYAVNIMDANGIILGIYKDNILDQATDSLYTLKEPPLLQLTTTQQNVYCYQGSDGWAEVSITGGTPPYQTSWSNGDTTLKTENLSAGTYTVLVIDSRGCEAMAAVTITEPEAPVMIAYPAYGRPTSIGASDAFIEALITGGTAFDDGSYTYVWTDKDGNNLNAQTNASVTADGYTIRLENITAGTYYLTTYDKNHEIATTKEGCTFIESEYAIYEPIEATIEVYVPISCNQANRFQDPFSDGALVAYVEGGVPFSIGHPYIYHWKKQNENGVWDDLTDQPDNIAYDLGDGLYALNVEDSRGSVMGIYEGDLLLKAIDSTFYFKEPELLQLNFTTTKINCDAGNDGTAEVHITGGVPPYNIRWSNGATTAKTENLIAGTYFVFVTDSRGCEATGNVVVAQPGGLQVDITEQKPPICYQGSDGRITVNVGGGIAPYQYQWNTGDQTNQIENLSAGTYTLKVTDSQGCIAYTEVILEDPAQVIINLGEDRTLCNNQELVLDITIDDPGAQYLWESDNGFSSTNAMVTLSSPGTYTATVTTSQGCMGQGEITIKASNTEIDAHFLLTSQTFVGEEVVLVNVSDPLSEVVEWFVPEGVETISQSHEAIILKFDEKGRYEVTLRSFEGECYQDYSKSVIVEEATELIGIGDAEEPFIKEFIVYPNPSNGNFTVKVVLSERSDASLRLISMLTAQVTSEKRLINNSEYEEPYQLFIPSGAYILLLETPKGNKIRKVIIE